MLCSPLQFFPFSENLTEIRIIITSILQMRKLKVRVV